MIVSAVILSWVVNRPVRLKPHMVSKLNTVAQILLALVVLLPFWWVFSSSIKAPAEIISRTPTMFPQSFTLEHFRKLLGSSDFPRYLLNSVLVSVISMAITVVLAVLAGGGLGFLAGLTGIGGGVFLTPLLIFLNWTPAKVAGGISALFIVVNSVAGLVGLGGKALIWQPVFVGAVVVGVAGALLGTHLGVNRWRTVAFRRALASVLWIAAGKLMLAGK